MVFDVTTRSSCGNPAVVPIQETSGRIWLGRYAVRHKFLRRDSEKRCVFQALMVSIANTP